MIWVSDNTEEQMPMWCPPTPPQQETDIYIDQTMSFLYDMNIMSESQLPPIYVKKELKRTRHDAGFVDSRRALKIPRKEDSMNAPKSLFHSASNLKMKRDLKLQKYRGLMRNTLPLSSTKSNTPKTPIETPIWHDWTIHEDMALLKVIQSFQGLPLNLLVVSPGHTPNWDFVADYVNTVSITYRSAKQCRQRYETVLIQREEGKQVFDNSLRKKKNKSGGTMQKFAFQPKTTRPMRTSQLYTQDNNSKFSQIMIQRYDSMKSIATKRPPAQRSLSNNPLSKNPKHTAMLTECGIDLDHPMLPVEVAARRAERLAREKKPMTPEQQLARFQMMKGLIPLSQSSTSASLPQVVAVSTGPVVTTTTTQATVTQTIVVSSVATTVSSAPATPPNTIRSQRILTSPLQASTVVSMASLSPAQLQAATQQRIIVSTNSPGLNKNEACKPKSPAQLQLIRQQSGTTFKQHLRLQPGTLASQAVKNSTVTIGGQQAVVQFSQAQPRAQFVRQGTVTLGTKTGITRTVTESEVSQLLKKQQQKTITATVATGTQASSIQGISSHVLAQAVQQAGTSGTQVAATLVKAVSNTGGVTQTVTIPVSGVTLANAAGKTITPALRATNTHTLRQLQFQQQLLGHKKLDLRPQKLNLPQVSGKNNVQTQLIVGPGPKPTINVQQFTQVMRAAPLGVRGPVVLAKPRMIPVNTSQGTKQTIQVLAATSQALSSALRPQGASTLAGALTGIKVQGQTNTQAQQALLSQVSAALQNQTVAVRQGSPVRLQTASGTSIVAVTVQPTSNVQQGTPQTSSAEQA